MNSFNIIFMKFRQKNENYYYRINKGDRLIGHE